MTAYDDLIESDSPAVHLPLHDASGTTATALSGSSGTYTGSPSLRQAGPLTLMAPWAVQFNGTGQYAFTSSRPGSGADLALECWYKPLTTPGGNSLIMGMAQGTSGNHAFDVCVDSSLRPHIRAWTGTERLTSVGSALTIGTWYHVVAQGDYGGNMAVYLDGASYGSGFMGNLQSLSGQGTIIGGRVGDYATASHNRVIGNVAGYSRLLTAGEIAERSAFLQAQTPWVEDGSASPMVMG